MSTISIDVTSFQKEVAAWRVPADYAQSFSNKCVIKGQRISLNPFFFNDTEHLTNARHWLAASTAFWCAVYREAENKTAQIEALAGIRASFYIAGALGIGEITAMIKAWWRHSYELHKLPAPSYSAAVKQPTFH